MSTPNQVIVLADDPGPVLRRLGEGFPDVVLVSTAEEVVSRGPGVLLLSGALDPGVVEAAAGRVAQLPGLVLAADLRAVPDTAGTGLDVTRAEWLGGVPVAHLAAVGDPAPTAAPGRLAGLLASLVPGPVPLDDRSERLELELATRTRDLETERQRHAEATAELDRATEKAQQRVERAQAGRRAAVEELEGVRRSPVGRASRAISGLRRRLPGGWGGVVLAGLVALALLAGATVLVAEIGRYALAALAVLTLGLVAGAFLVVLGSVHRVDALVRETTEATGTAVQDGLRAVAKEQRAMTRSIRSLAEADADNAQQLARVEAAVTDARALFAGQGPAPRESAAG